MSKSATIAESEAPALVMGAADIANPQVIEWANQIANEVAALREEIYIATSNPKNHGKHTRKSKVPPAIRVRLDTEEYGPLNELWVTINLTDHKVQVSLHSKHSNQDSVLCEEDVEDCYLAVVATDCLLCSTQERFTEWFTKRGGTKRLTWAIVELLDDASRIRSVCPLVY